LVALAGLLLLLFVGAVGCHEGADDACRRDADCPAGYCEVSTGVCLRFRNPLDAAVPDLSAPPRDAAGSD
jgi:hypothetical protein